MPLDYKRNREATTYRTRHSTHNSKLPHTQEQYKHRGCTVLHFGDLGIILQESGGKHRKCNQDFFVSFPSGCRDDRFSVEYFCECLNDDDLLSRQVHGSSTLWIQKKVTSVAMYYFCLFPFLSFLLDSNCVVLVLELLRLW
jgi:hypothetical protein